MNNIIAGGGAAAGISGPYTAATWSGNVVFHTTGGDMPPGSFVTNDPKLVKDAAGVFQPAATFSFNNGPQKLSFGPLTPLRPADVGAAKATP